MGRKIPKQEYLIYLPTAIDLNALTAKKPSDIKFDKIAYMIYIITQAMSKNELPGEYAKLYSLLLKKKFGSQYKAVIKFLIDNDIVECNGKYSVTRHTSLGYRINGSILNSELKEYAITDNVLIKNIKEFSYLDNNDSPAFLSPTLNQPLKENFDKWFNANLTIEFKEAEAKLKDMQFKESSQVAIAYEAYMTNKSSSKLRKEYYKLVKNQETYNYRIIPALKIKNHQFATNFDFTAGRLHTPLTALKKELRPYLKYGGKNLVSIDIKNSQPYLSTIFFDKEKFQLNKISSKLMLYNDKLDYNQSPIAHHYVSNNIPAEIGQYIADTTSGKFYELFISKLEAKNLIPKGITNKRAYVKNIIFSAFFSPNHLSKHLEEAMVFKDAYPSVFEDFEFIKKDRRHNTLACTLQNIEAEIILSDICGFIFEYYPHIPIFTIHDSIVTTEEHKDLVYNLMKKTLTEKIGYAPQLSVEYWKEETAQK